MTAELWVAASTPLVMLMTWGGATLLSRRSDTQRRLNGLERRERIRDDYINVLRQHISDGKPPPPPPWPEGLTRGEPL